MKKIKTGEPVLGLTFWGGAPQRGKGTEIEKMSIGGRREVGGGANLRDVRFFFSGSSLRRCGRGRGYVYPSASVCDFIKL